MRWFIEFLAADQDHFVAFMVWFLIFVTATVEVVKAFRKPPDKE